MRERISPLRIALYIILAAVIGLVGVFFIMRQHPNQSLQAAKMVEPVSPDIRVLTANINILLPTDGIHRWVLRRVELIKVLNAIHADIIGMQASTPAQTAWLAANMPQYSHFPDGVAIHRSLSSALAGPLSTWNQIWYRKKRFQRLAGAFGMVRPHHPEKNPTENTYYSLIVLRDRAKAFPDLMVLDVHLRHTDANAAKSADKLHTILLQWQHRYPAAHAILLGDMNHSRKEQSIYSALLGNASDVPLTDTFDYALHKPGERWGTWENYTDHIYRVWPTDLIFVSPQLAHSPAHIVRYHVPPEQYPSKHLFVLTVLTPSLKY